LRLRAQLREYARFWQISGQERAFLFRSLGVMFNSGCGLVPALDMLAQQLENPHLREAALSLSKFVSSGHYLSNAMAKLPWAFTSVQTRMVQVGEKSGRLAQVLIRLADHEDKTVALKLKVRTALTMPLIICCMCLTMVVIMPPFLFGGLFEILRETGGELPLATKILMTFSDALRGPVFWVAVVAGLVATALGVLRHNSDTELQIRTFQALLRIPAVGSVLRLVTLTRFASGLETMLAVGIPVLQGLQLAGQSSGNAFLEEITGQVVKQVKEGDGLAEALSAHEFFPRAFVQGVAAGEEAGRLQDMLGSLTELYQVELDHSLELLTKSLEPLIMGAVGGIVCFVVVATLAPMLKVVESL
jgi:type IV pilus assembly protein PilC